MDEPRASWTVLRSVGTRNELYHARSPPACARDNGSASSAPRMSPRARLVRACACCRGQKEAWRHRSPRRPGTGTGAHARHRPRSAARHRHACIYGLEQRADASALVTDEQPAEPTEQQPAEAPARGQAPEPAEPMEEAEAPAPSEAQDASKPAVPWAQCGGDATWKGPSSCVEGTTCVQLSSTFSQVSQAERKIESA